MFKRRLSLRTLFFLTPSRSLSPYSIFLAQCSTSSPSHLTHSHDARNVKVSVWWDLDKCTVPPGVNAVRGAQAITAAIKSRGIKGPIQITTFGDMLRHARTNREALSSTAIKFTHIPHGVNSASRSLYIDLMFWVSQNPPPAHLFLIIVDKGFTSTLHRLVMENYNILLASKESVPASLKSAATIMWNWDALVTGENLTGTYFNHPPMTPCYGHYEGPLEHPFTKIERPPNHEVFSQDSIWRDVQTFINTDLGSFIIAESRNREKLAYYLQKYGPSVLKSVTRSDVLLMVGRLISEKKWVLESPYLIEPFKLPSSAGITSANSDGTDSDYEFAYSDDDSSDSEQEKSKWA